MKKRMLLTLVTGMLFSIAMAASAAAYSDDRFSAIEMEEAEGFHTSITDTEGDVHTFEGVINAEGMGENFVVSSIASYEIYQADRQIIHVELNDIIPSSDTNAIGVPETLAPNGYYAVRFELSPADHTEAFLTGLTNANLALVQEKLVTAVLENSQFTMESLDFIDAEKTDLPSDGDDLLCWAASTANTLAFTGWGKKAGFSSTDDLLDLFVDSFTDVGGHQLYGLEWFFNGVYQMSDLPGWAQEKEPGKIDGYLPEYSSNQIVKYWGMTDQPKQIVDVMHQLENGCGLGIGIGWIDGSGNRQGGHAITCWGYICDNDLAVDDRGHYQALIVSDSDSDMQKDPNRRTAPNKLQVLNMSLYQQGQYDSWKFDGYGNVGVLEDFVTLLPYSDDVAYEADETATKKRKTSPDLMVSSLSLTNDELDVQFSGTNFKEGDTLYMVPRFYNAGAENSSQTFSYTVAVTGDKVEPQKDTYTYKGSIPAFGESDVYQTEKTKLSNLPAGDYTLTVTVNPDHKSTEAYFYNNEFQFDFTVSSADYDISKVKMNASVGAMKDGEAQVSFTYEGLEDVLFLQDPDAADYILMRSYCIGDDWTYWEVAAVSDETPPDTCTIYNEGSQVKFRLVIYPVDADSPVQQIYSNSCTLAYQKFEVLTDEKHTIEPTPLKTGAKALNQGEQFAFRIRNDSTDGSEQATCSAVVYAVKGDEQTELFRTEPMTLRKGACSDTISFSSWDAELSGRYDIVVAVESDSGTVAFQISTLEVAEKASYGVTTPYDITDPYDGETSLREAVAEYAESGGVNDRITIPEGEIIYLDKPIDIETGRIVIECPAASPDSQSKGAAISGPGTAQMFRVGKSGDLTISEIMLAGGYGKAYGGAIENNGGTVSLRQCMLYYNTSGLAGGALYSNGGSMLLLNCSFVQNSAGYGGAVGTDGDAAVTMLNCNVVSNSSNSGAVYNNGGTVNALYSTFTNNSANSDGGGAITSLGITNAAGCIFTANGSLDLGGNINVFGSYFTAADAKVTADSLSRTGGPEQLFVLDEEGKPAWVYSGEGAVSLFLIPYLTDRIHEGVIIKEDGNGSLIVSADGTNWETTGIHSDFPDAAYVVDMMNNPHERLFGSYAKAAETAVHTVAFDSQGGSAVESVSVAAGGKVEKPTDPTRGGYAFDGWYKESACETVWNFDTDMVTEDMTLYAKWTWNSSGGSGGGSAAAQPSARVEGAGGKVTTGSGAVTITPDKGYRISKITVNGNVVDIPANGKLTGLKRTDEVVVTFEKIPDEPSAADMSKYTDLDAGAWYFESVRYVVEHGLFAGTSDTAFSPNAPMTRAMLMTVLARADGQDTTTPAGGKWYDAGMRWAVERGISDGTNPDGSLTREQLATMLYRYAGSPAAANPALDFTDAGEVSDFAQNAIRWAVEQGILTGRGAGVLDPKGNATRAEVAAMLMRYLSTLNK